MNNVARLNGAATVDHAKALVDAYHLPRLATVILRMRLRNPRGELRDLHVDQQRALTEAAAVALLSHDPAWHRPALYAAAHDIRDLGALTVGDRRVLIGALELFLTTYRAVLAGDRPDDRRKFGQMALADLHDGGQ